MPSISFQLRLALAISSLLFAGADWPQFRKDNANSAAEGASPPVRWSESENTAWRADLPGRGVSSPIVVAGRVVVTANTGVNQDRLHVLCFDCANGRLAWHRQFWATGRTETHALSANAAPTPASDGTRIYALYSSNDLIALDLDGRLQWVRGLGYDYPQIGNDVGLAASPAVVDGTVLVQIENQGESFAAGIDADTGETRWRINRQRGANWSSPILFRDEHGPAAVLLQSPGELTALEARSGKHLWSFKANCPTITSSAALANTVYVPADGVIALQLKRGAEPQTLWTSSKVQPAPCCPVVARLPDTGDSLLAINNAGVLACASAADGKLQWRLRLKGRFWGTPAVLGNKLYAFNEDGLAQVVELGAKRGRVLGEQAMGEKILSSPAIVDGALYVRSEKHLWKIASGQPD